MNIQQRLAVGFLVYSLVATTLLAPLHGLPLRKGLVMGFIVYIAAVIVAMLFEWMIAGDIRNIRKVFKIERGAGDD